MIVRHVCVRCSFSPSVATLIDFTCTIASFVHRSRVVCLFKSTFPKHLCQHVSRTPRASRRRIPGTSTDRRWERQWRVVFPRPVARVLLPLLVPHVVCYLDVICPSRNHQQQHIVREWLLCTMQPFLSLGLGMPTPAGACRNAWPVQPLSDLYIWPCSAIPTPGVQHQRRWPSSVWRISVPLTLVR